MANVEITQKISSCKINKTTIIKIINVIEKEIDKIPKEDTEHSKPEWDFKIETQNKKITIHDMDELNSQEIPQKLKRLRISFRWYRTTNLDINVLMGFEWWETSEIDVSSNDSILTNGILREIMDILTQTSTKNYLVHNIATKILICLSLSLVISFIIFNLVTSNVPNENELISNSVSILIFWLSFFLFYIYLGHLFPIIEFEGRGPQQKIYKVIFGIIIALISGGIIQLSNLILFP